MVKNSPATSGDMGLVPDPGGSHMLGATEPMNHNYSTTATTEACSP